MALVFTIIICTLVAIILTAILGAFGVWRHVLGADGEKVLLDAVTIALFATAAVGVAAFVIAWLTTITVA